MAAGDITYSLIERLKDRLEDNDTNSRFTDYYSILNEAQIELCNVIDNKYLKELEAVDTGKGISGVTLLFSQLNDGNGVLGGEAGIVGVKIYPGGSSGIWGRRIEVADLQMAEENGLISYSDSRPFYYMFKDRIWFLLSTYESSTADIYYRRRPATISANVDPEINEELYDILLDLAEYRGWKMDRDNDRTKTALELAYSKIKMLNDKIK